MAQVVGIALKEGKRSLVISVPSIEITAEGGLKGDFRGGGGFTHKRQVTVLSVQQWEQACEELDTSLPWQTRRANLYVNRLTFSPDHIGKILFIDTTVELEITGETKPCERMDEAYPGLKDALSIKWRGGVTCRVRKGGMVYLNSPVRLI